MMEWSEWQERSFEDEDGIVYVYHWRIASDGIAIDGWWERKEENGE